MQESVFTGRKHFSASGSKLFFMGKEVVVRDKASDIVNKQFKQSCGSGCRPISHQLKETFANVTEASIKDFVQIESVPADVCHIS